MGQDANYHFDGSGTGVATGAGKRLVKATYSFAVHGGAQGSIPIASLAAGARILGGWMEVEVVPVGAGASIGVSSEAAGDIVAVAAIIGAPWSTLGKKAIIPKANTPETTSITTTVARTVNVVISGADLTAGKISLFLEVLG